jgi:dihydroxy-acid dehydratase
LKNVGPKGYPGMPEVGNMTLPLKLIEKGVKDMIRISDGRMSGTGFGTVVLHVSPEATLGGNFSVLETGDIITLDLEARSLNVDLSDAELNARKEKWIKPKNLVDRGYTGLYINNVEQAHLGADFHFLKGGSGSEVTRDSH